MFSFDYACDVCGHTYNEVRNEGEPQWFTLCPVSNCTGSLIEVISETPTV